MEIYLVARITKGKVGSEMFEFVHFKIVQFRKKNKKNRGQQEQEQEHNLADGINNGREAKEPSASLSSNLGQADLIKIKKAMELLQVQVSEPQYI
jgi:hypothetical protein